MQTWPSALNEAHKVLGELLSNKEIIKNCESLAKDIVNAFNQKKKVLVCGNGGSHCDALHFAEEFTGRFRKERRALPVIALGEASHTTCVGNDYGFDKVFSRQVEALGNDGDILLVLTTSGNSLNIVESVHSAKERNIKTWALLGKDGGKVAQISDSQIIVPGKTTDRIQELHMLLLHIIIEDVERTLFPENYT